MNLRQIEVFRAVVSTGSTTEAAHLLHVSQPGISRMIKHLELQLGVALFERRSGRLTATTEAKALFAESERVFKGVKHVQDVAAHLRFGTHSTLRVVSSANTSLQLVPRTIAGTLAQLPASRVLFESLPSREISNLLVSEESDVAITSASLDHPALESQLIGEWELLCAFPSEHPILQATSLSLKSALHDKLITFSSAAPQSRVIDDWLDQFQVTKNVVAEVRSGFSACALVASGIGIAFVDDLSARAHRPDGLSFVGIKNAPRFPIYLVRNKHRAVSRLGKIFAETAVVTLQDIKRQHFLKIKKKIS